MMKIKSLAVRKSTQYIFLAALLLLLVYIVLRVSLFHSDPVLPLLDFLYKGFLVLPESIANQIFEMSQAGVRIVDHTFIFEGNETYQAARLTFFENWSKFLLYKRWSGLILLLIWLINAPLRKKILFTFLFFMVHFISIISGLYLLGVAGPYLFENRPDYFLSPTLLGTIFMYTFLAFWLKTNQQLILKNRRIEKYGLSKGKINEILVVLFFFLLLRTLVIDFFYFPNYVRFLLEVTRGISSFFFHQNGFIDGDQLVGSYGALALSKHCLGFMTMYLFAGLVYLTRPKNRKVTWIYMISGLGILFILNIIRLVAVFLVAQGENGYERANMHHEIYNVVIYVAIFVMWIVWFEFFVGLRKKNKSKKEVPVREESKQDFLDARSEKNPDL